MPQGVKVKPWGSKMIKTAQAALASTMEKFALRRGAKMVKALISKGNLPGANQLAGKFKGTGALKETGPGSQMKFLGSGGEGPAHLVAGARDAPGLSVRKAFDPKSPLVGKSALEEKMNVGRRSRASDVRRAGEVQRLIDEGNPQAASELASKPRLSTLYSRGLGKGRGGTRYLQYEYVPEAGAAQRQALMSRPGTAERLATSRKEVAESIPGRKLEDLHADNMRLTPGGQAVAIDYAPVPLSSYGARNPEFERLRRVIDQLEERGAKGGPKMREYLKRRAGANQFREMWGGQAGAGQMESFTNPAGQVAAYPRRADVQRALRGL